VRGIEVWEVWEDSDDSMVSISILQVVKGIEWRNRLFTMCEGGQGSRRRSDRDGLVMRMLRVTDN
jgi:hypothetical protein